MLVCDGANGKISNDSAGLKGMFSGEKTQPARCSISQLKKQAYFQPDPMFKRGAVHVKASSLGLEEPPPHGGQKRAAPARNH